MNPYVRPKTKVLTGKIVTNALQLQQEEKTENTIYLNHDVPVEDNPPTEKITLITEGHIGNGIL